MLPNDPDSNLLIDKRLDSYAAFFNGDWADEQFKLTDGTKLAPIMWELLVSWRLTSNAMRWPWMMFLTLENQQTGIAQGTTKAMVNHVMPRVINDIQRRIQSEFRASSSQRNQIVRILQEVSDRLTASSAESKATFPREQMWSRMTEDFNFGSSIVATQSLCYGSLYYAYENFIRQCMAIVMATDDYRMQKIGQMVETLDATFGQGTGNALFNKPEIVVGRFTRHALAHNGGKMTRDLAKQKHSLTVERDGTICIVPDDIRRLYDALKSAITSFVQTHHEHSLFRCD